MAHRIIFMNINALNLNLHSKYIVGSEVGAKNRSVYRALKRRANNNVNGTPCCNVANSLIPNNALPISNYTTYVFFTAGNILTILVGYFNPNIDNNTIADFKTVRIFDNYGYIKQATGVNVINEVSVISGPPGLAYFVIAPPFASDSPSSGPGIVPITVNGTVYNAFLANFAITFNT